MPRRQPKSQKQNRRPASNPAPTTPSRTAVQSPAAGQTTTVTDGNATSVAAATMNCYVDIAAVRIQTWLLRTPALRPRRGASTALAHHTSRDVTEAVLAAEGARAGGLPAGLTWNEEAGEVSGVVSLKFPVGPQSTQRSAACAVATLVADEIRRALPALPLQARYGVASDYPRAYDDAKRRFEREGPILDLPAMGTDFSAAKPCDVCRQSAAVASCPKDGDDQPCRDCAERFVHAGRHRQLAAMPASQRDLLERIRSLDPRIEWLAADYDEVARGGAVGAGNAATQVATIFADGNRIGDVMESMMRRAGAIRPIVVPLLDTVTKSAVARAAVQELGGPILDAGEGSAVVPIIAHIAGGDEVLVTVAAPQAWAFARALCREFEKQSGTPGLLPDAPSLNDVLKDRPSLGLGMVFHHSSHPFTDVLHRAEELIEAAKKSVAAREAALAYLDLTFDGDLAPSDEPGRPLLTERPTVSERCFPLEELRERGSRLGRLAAVPRSQQQMIRSLIVDSAAGRDEPGAFDALLRRITTMHLQPVIESIGGPRADASTVRALLAVPEQRAAALVKLRQDLDLARWWPPDTRNHENTQPTGPTGPVAPLARKAGPS